ncbi:hypothetical protein [Nonomuraea africana]|uniref:DUF2116 family Zn-ribbon domain-containing protein n=1 Tax=Nonomuraea africana TaxID=46171 RepID=A0ABR9KWA6_9ACTN|nr:hypothetical protein [Nonomuraea africana]MBE1565812.1 hypothetical protein [Nonomuraea africana]
MSCEHLVCAQCAHPVIEGRCALCRANRERMHVHGISPMLILAALIALLFLSLAIQHLL